MSPMYFQPQDPNIVLFEQDGWSVCKFERIDRPLLMHHCSDYTIPEESFRVIEDPDRWVCTHCANEPPDDVVTVHLMMDGARRNSKNYYNAVRFSGLTVAK